MERIVLRHLSGSKANQVEEFPLNYFKELVFGRDPSSSVKYDPDRDDLVGRQHAKLAQDPGDPSQFILTDLNSRNGTFVNRQRIVGTVRIGPGDTVQFGAGGPEFQFDLEPRPNQAIRPTRMGEGGTAGLGSAAPTTPPTRMGAQSPSGLSPVVPGPTMPASGQVGKATVERMIAQSSKQSKGYLIVGGIALVVIIAIVAGVLIYHQISSNRQIASDTKNALDSAAANAPMTPADIAKNYTNSVVYIEAGWKLIYTPTGGQVYHRYIANQYKDSEGNVRPLYDNGRASIATYVFVDQNTAEPLLTSDANGGVPIGGELTGSGFTVTSDGFILTNRHVAATWRTTYYFPQSADVGVVIQNNRIAYNPNGTPILVKAPTN
ncbi:MAG TPA: FHA domain-containing protein, partial [Blastocatellia bacterium]|nr:FHA domain-containing protein [Blastocatellia bacterium]